MTNCQLDASKPFAAYQSTLIVLVRCLAHTPVAISGRKAASNSLRARAFSRRKSAMHVDHAIFGTFCLMLAISLLGTSLGAGTTNTLAKWMQGAKGYESWIIRQQEHLHTIPEVQFDTPETYAHLTSVLEQLGIAHRRPASGVGIIATIGSGQPVIVLRSDMDGLPIVETGNSSVKSQHKGKGHMCGHDGHMAMLLGGIRLLHDDRQSLKGTVRAIFQPAEEGGAGAKKMIQEGALEGTAAALALHVVPHVHTGILSSRAGTMMSGAYTVSVTVKGKGGHAGLPHLSRDPVVTAAAIILALQTLVSRETDPLMSSVISITQIDAGTDHNVIANQATLQGTIRALDPSWLTQLRQRFIEVVNYQALSYGCTADIDWHEEDEPYYPPTVNDPRVYTFAMDVAQRLIGENNTDGNFTPMMATEDFAFFTRTIPSVYVAVGIRNETLGSVHGLHNGNFMLDQAALKYGAAMHAAFASEWLNDKGEQGDAHTGMSDEL